MYLLLVVASVLGQLTGESLGFAVGRRYGPALRDGRVGRWTGVARWARAERLLAVRGPAALVAAHFVPVAHAAAPLVAGTLGMSYRRFLAASAAGSLAWSLCYVGLGVAGDSAYRQYGATTTTVALIAVAALVAGCVALGHLRAGRAPKALAATGSARRPLRVLVVAESFLPAVNGVAGSVCRVVEHVTAAGGRARRWRARRIRAPPRRTVRHCGSGATGLRQRWVGAGSRFREDAEHATDRHADTDARTETMSRDRRGS